MNGRYDHPDSSMEEAQHLFDEKTLSDLELDAAELETERRFASFHWVTAVKPWIRSIRVQSWRTTAGRIAWWTLPSFVQSAIISEEKKPEKLYPTAYLDGLRGLAALFVFFCHYSYGFFVITNGFGFERGDQKHYNPLELPIIRLIFSGPPMVCLFFVISGYALSLKPLKLMRSRSYDALSTTMASSIFRRGLRLFLPTTISTFMIFLLVRFGFYETNRAFTKDKAFMRNVYEFHMDRFPSFADQFRDWIQKVFNFVYVWGWESFGGSTDYDPHLWTIPVEFRCSLVLFLVLMGTAKLKTWIRWTCLLGVTLFSYRNARWEVVLFFAGMFLAELDLIRASKRISPLCSPLPDLEKSTHTKTKSLIKEYFWPAFGIFALYLMSQPDQDFAETPGWVWLSSLIPHWFPDKYRYWQCVGSILYVLATNFSPLLQRPLNTPAVRYLGKISYAIYLMHGPVMHTIGYTILRWAWGVTGHQTESQYVSGFLLGSVFVIPLTIWISDLFMRVVDQPTVKFARWLEEKCDAVEPR